MQKTVSVFAPCKINLTLQITGVRGDGYHTLRSYMQAVSLGDRLQVSVLEGEGISLWCSEDSIPTDGRNTAVKAASRYLEEAGIPRRVEIKLWKQTPHEAGLGGGSADAAAVLRALETICEALGEERLYDLAAQIGADVPFCLLGGAARAEGIGEVLIPVPSLPDCYILIAKPDFGASTAEIYACYDRTHKTTSLSPDRMASALERGKLSEISLALCNDLECCVGLERIGPIKQSMTERGAFGTLMTGSGSAVYGLFFDGQAAQRAKELFEADGFWAYVCRPVSHGIEVEEFCPKAE